VCTSSMLLSGSESRWLPLVFSVPSGNDGSEKHQLVAAAMRSQSAFSVAEAKRDQQCCTTTIMLSYDERGERGEKNLWCDPVIVIQKY
jgi:hypothetical protein